MLHHLLSFRCCFFFWFYRFLWITSSIDLYTVSDLDGRGCRAALARLVPLELDNTEKTHENGHDRKECSTKEDNQYWSIKTQTCICTHLSEPNTRKLAVLRSKYSHMFGKSTSTYWGWWSRAPFTESSSSFNSDVSRRVSPEPFFMFHSSPPGGAAARPWALRGEEPGSPTQYLSALSKHFWDAFRTPGKSPESGENCWCECQDSFYKHKLDFWATKFSRRLTIHRIDSRHLREELTKP